jgi:hypothetical protein
MTSNIGAVEVDGPDLLPQLSVTVKIRNNWRFLIRNWIGSWCLRVASWCFPGMEIKFHEDAEE